MSAPMPSMSKLLMTQSISSLGPTTNPSRDRNMETTTLLMGNRILPTAGLPSTQSSLFLCFRLQEFQDHPVRKAWLYGNKKHVVSVPRFILLEICELFYGAANDSLRCRGLTRISPFVLVRRRVWPSFIPSALQKTTGMAILRLFPTLMTLTSSSIVTMRSAG